MDFENKPLKTALEHAQSPEGTALEQKWAEENKPYDPEIMDPEEAADKEAYARRVAADDQKKLAEVRAELDLPPVEDEDEDEYEKISAAIIEMIESGDLGGAESLMLEYRDKFGPDWTDHKSNLLFNAYLQNEDWKGAERMIFMANGPLPMEGRRKKLEIESGKDVIPGPKITYKDQIETNESHEALENTNDFRDAVLSGRLAEAEEWLLANKDKEKYDINWLDHRSGELFDAYRALGRLDDAERMIAYSSDDNSRNGRKQAIEIDREKATSSTESSPEKEKKIENTDGFDKAIAEGRIAEAEAWMMREKDRQYAGNDRWFRLQTEKLYHYFRDVTKDWKSAKRMTEVLPEGDAKEGRKKDLTRRTGKPYEQI